MVSIPTPIPKTLVRVTKRAFRGAAFDIIWKLFVATILILAAYSLAMLGVVGAAISGVILASLFTEPVRRSIVDVWNRNFWVFRT